MLDRIKEIRSCINDKHYEAALALSLTLPDICGQVEYPGETEVGRRYKDWIDNFVDDSAFDANFYARVFEGMTPSRIYKLRCSFLHSGNDDLQNESVDEFYLITPELAAQKQSGYIYGTRKETDGSLHHTIEVDIVYLCEVLCASAEKYYQTRSPSDFDNHSFVLKS